MVVVVVQWLRLHASNSEDVSSIPADQPLDRLIGEELREHVQSAAVKA